MEETEINGSATYLPEEIITNIFMRLPVKSLMRFRCVCKYWENLFKTQFFIAAHLRHSHQNPFLIFSDDYLFDDLPLRLLDCEMQLRDVQKAPLFNSLVRASCFKITGSSNGLLCFVTMRYSRFPPSILLWNPATRHWREVPMSRTINYDKHFYELGFGFSTLVNDYKILVIYALYPDRMVCGMDVYSLNKGSWKEIEVGNLFDTICGDMSTVSCNGAIFTHGLKLGKDVIVSFEIATEVFTLMPWPPLSGDLSINLTVYEDKLALLASSGIEAPSKVDLWVIEEDMSSSEERWNWIKKFTSNPLPWVFTPGTIWRNEIVVSGTEIGGEIEENERCLCLFNVTTNEFKTFAISGYYSLHEFINYVESLVPVGINVTTNEYKSRVIPRQSLGDIVKSFLRFLMA